MRWNRAAATLLLGWQGSAQLFNGLPHIDHFNAGKIADSIAKTDPSKDLAHMAGALKDAAKIPDSVAKIPDSVKGLASEKTVGDVAGMLKGATEKNLSQVVQAATDGFHEAAQKLNRTEANVFRPAVTEATKAAQVAQSSVQEWKGMLPSSMADKGREAVKTVQIAAADKDKVEHVLSVAGNTIAKAVDERRRKRENEGATERIREVIREMETPDWWNSHWPWVALVLALLSTLIAGAVYVHRTFLSKGPRSPNLLVDSEINMWVRPGGGGRQMDTHEEPLFRQF